MPAPAPTLPTITRSTPTSAISGTACLQVNVPRAAPVAFAGADQAQPAGAVGVADLARGQPGLTVAVAHPADDQEVPAS
jgi:hypothetical protein